MENSIYYSKIIYNSLKQLNLCRIYSQTYIKHILAIILSVFTAGFKGNLVLAIELQLLIFLIMENGMTAYLKIP